MIERPWWPTDAELERALADLHAHLAYPPARDLAARVRARLLAEQAAPAVARRGPHLAPVRGLRRAVALALLALAVLAGGVLAASPDARTAVAQWLGLHGIVIFYSPPPRTLAPVGTRLQLGRRTTLAAAQRRVPFHILTPARALGRPDEVYVAALPGGSQIALVYRARRNLPRAAGTGVGLLLTEVPGDVMAAKFVEPGTSLQFISINGGPGFWISGKPHVFAYMDNQGRFHREQVRLAGNVLLWNRAGLVLRLEAALPESAALRIAAAVR